MFKEPSAAAQKRWQSAASRNERAEKHIAKLIELAPPLTATQRAKLQALLSQPGA